MPGDPLQAFGQRSIWQYFGRRGWQPRSIYAGIRVTRFNALCHDGQESLVQLPAAESFVSIAGRIEEVKSISEPVAQDDQNMAEGAARKPIHEMASKSTYPDSIIVGKIDRLTPKEKYLAALPQLKLAA